MNNGSILNGDDPRKVRAMPPRRNYNPQDRYNNEEHREDRRNDDSFSQIQLAAILTKLEEGYASHTKAIDAAAVEAQRISAAQAQEAQRTSDNIHQLVLAVRGVTDGLSVVKESLGTLDSKQNTILHNKESEHSEMRDLIQKGRELQSTHESRITALEAAAKTAGNRLFDVGKSSVAWILSGGLFFVALAEFLSQHWK